jgi:hypothetical protein
MGMNNTLKPEPHRKLGDRGLKGKSTCGATDGTGERAMCSGSDVQITGNEMCVQTVAHKSQVNKMCSISDAQITGKRNVCVRLVTHKSQVNEMCVSGQ